MSAGMREGVPEETGSTREVLYVECKEVIKQERGGCHGQSRSYVRGVSVDQRNVGNHRLTIL